MGYLIRTGALGAATATKTAPHDKVSHLRSETVANVGPAPSTLEPSSLIEPLAAAAGVAHSEDSLFGCNHWLPMPSCPHCAAAVAKRWQVDAAANDADHSSMAAVGTGGAAAPSTASAIGGGDYIPPPTRK